MNRVCPKCNSENPATNVFCGNCGFSLRPFGPQRGLPGESSPDKFNGPNATAAARPVFPWIPALGIAGGLLALVFFGLVLSNFLRNSNPPSQQANNLGPGRVSTGQPTDYPSLGTSPAPTASTPLTGPTPTPEIAVIPIPTVTPVKGEGNSAPAATPTENLNLPTAAPTKGVPPPPAGLAGLKEAPTNIPPTVQPAPEPTSPPPVRTTAAPTAVLGVAKTPASSQNQPKPTAQAKGQASVVGAVSPYQLQGAYKRDDGKLYGLPEIALYGEGSGYSQGTVNFKLDGKPDRNVYLILTGLDDERAEHCQFQISLNGVVVYDRANSFPNVPNNDNGEGGTPRFWGQLAIPLTPDTFVPGTNTLVLRNKTPWAGYLGIPYILINSLEFGVE